MSFPVYQNFLPADYLSLTSAGKKAARLGCLARRNTPDEYAAAWEFFRYYYLGHSEALFYKDWAPSPLFHYELVKAMRSPTHLVAACAPRGYAKSTAIGKEVPLLEICSPTVAAMEIGITLAKDQMVEGRFDEFMLQLEENPRIRDDFGRLKAPLGAGIWNRHELRLTNRVHVIGYSVDGRKRGARPDLMIIDDPENDPQASTDHDRVIDDFEQVLLRQILGMLSPKSRLYWVGTLLHRRAFLYHIMRSNNPQYKKWTKIFVAEGDPSNPRSTLLWPERFTREFLTNKMETMGRGAFFTEYGNDPQSDSDPLLQIDRVLNEYEAEDPSNFQAPQLTPQPLVSPVRIRYNECGKGLDGAFSHQEKIVEFGPFARGMRRFAMVDYASTDKATSDYSAIVVVGLDDRNTLWVLDAWQGRVRPHDLTRIIWEYGQKWMISVVGIEAVALQDEIRQQIADAFDLMSIRGQWTPRVVPIKYKGGVSKASRIASLEWRFRRGRIKFPSYLERYQDHYGHMAKLREQVHSFTMDLTRMDKDDLVDALSMFHSMMAGSGKIVDVPLQPQTIQEHILAGELHVKGHEGISWLSGLTSAELTDDIVAKLYDITGYNPEERFAQEQSRDESIMGAPHWEDDTFQDHFPGGY